MKALKKFWVRHTALAIGAICSLGLLGIFFWFQHDNSKILNLESRWLITAGVPLLAALIVGGYIKSFKGFGVELEASLNKPVTNIELTATEAKIEMPGDEKRTIGYLDRLSLREKTHISRLVLIQGRKDYYSPHALERYINELSNLKYIEIQSINGGFVALIRVDEFKRRREINHRREIDHNLLVEFISALEQSQILQRHSGSLITSFVMEDTGLIESLKVMRKKNIKELVVLDENRVFMGVLLSRSVERKIVDSVLSAKENA